jgi:mannosyltransferase
LADRRAPAGRLPVVDPSKIEVIAPNFKRRFTGVSATVLSVVPRQARSVPIATVGAGLGAEVPRIPFTAMLRAGWSPPPGRPFRIWHARRNPDMLAGLILKHLLRQKLQLAFTSAAIRRHSPFPRFLIGRMDAVIATTPEAARLVPNVVATIPHGVDTARFLPPPDKAAAWAEGGLPGRHGIGIFGRIRPEKGTDIFIDAMCRLLPDYPDFTAVVAGRCAPEHQSFRDTLVRRVAAAGLAERVLWVGEIGPAELPVWYRRILIGVAPARYEGYGLTILEAMASGCSVVATRTGAFAAMIGDAGRILPAVDSGALTEALRPLLADPAAAEEMGRTARQRAADGFSADREAEAINGVYRAMWSGTLRLQSQD